MAKIKQISAREILNAKGNPTIETTVILSDGATGTASSPTGTSVGKYEAVDLKDNDSARYQGLGVLNAIMNIEKLIAPNLIGMDSARQQEIDKKMIDLDGTQNKGRLGANATLSVSMAVAKASARSSVLPLFLYLREFIKKESLPLKIPTPLFNLINGGKHAQDNFDFQEFLVIPATSKPYEDALKMVGAIYNSLRKNIETNNLSTLIGDEGGFSPKLATNQDALLLLKRSVESANLRLGFDVFFGLDTASNNFYSQNAYHLKDKTSSFSAKDLIAFYKMLNEQYHFLYLEDGLAEDDWDNWSELCRELSGQTLIVGDDLTATNPYRLQTALGKKAITGIIIKPNQIGTVIEALAVVEMAREAGLKITVSHRSGETNDDFIADFAVAASADYVKFGAPARGERVAKYNRLLQIQTQLKAL
ncbi:MAG TPA: phosphopyruvate hydratase [Patescibacteria group bacterium]|jgi:enolase|nr:phosphopyruvate hydratase [Patescibacteria group bacterium]